MTTYTDIQNSIAGLTTVISSLQTAVTNLQNAQAGSITPAEADTIATGINTATTALTSLAASITPAA